MRVVQDPFLVVVRVRGTPRYLVGREPRQNFTGLVIASWRRIGVLKTKILVLSLLRERPEAMRKVNIRHLIFLAYLRDDLDISIVSSMNCKWSEALVWLLVGMIPINSFLWVATFNDRPNPSTMSMNKKWERGYPCLIPIEEWKVGDGEHSLKWRKKKR